MPNGYSNEELAEICGHERMAHAGQRGYEDSCGECPCLQFTEETEHG